MKRIYNYILIVAISIAYVGCEDNLDPNLYGTITADNFFQSEEDLNSAATAIYHELRLGGWAPYLFSDGSSFAMDEVATEEWTTRWSWTSFLNGKWNVGDAMTNGFYNQIAPAVTRCTYTMKKIEESPVDTDIKLNYIAQIRALRAFFVYDIYRLYGPMPLIVDSEKALNPDPDYKPQRPSTEEIKQLIETELRTAADDLPVQQQDYGKVTKGAALAYLLKYYMHEKEWQSALNTSDEIIGLGYYQLEPVYANIFSAQNEGNRELIFVVPGEPLESYGNHTYVNILPGDFKSPWGNSISGWNGHRMPWAFYDTFDETDLRRNLAVAKYEAKSGEMIDLRESGDIGVLPLKYGIDPEANGIWAGNDKVLDRYAEVLLYKAEALNELNGPNQESIDLINQIRKRAFEGAVEEPEKIILNEDFEGEISDNVFGAFSMNNFQEDVASFSFDKDTEQSFADGNSLHLTIENSGNEWWAIQVRADGIPVDAGKEYTISVKIKASKDISFDLRSEGPLAFTKTINLAANESTEISFSMGQAAETGNAVIFFALGNSGNDYEVWFDSVELKQKAKETGGGNYLLSLSDFDTTEALRDRILRERGWEFWYEGKRREDLIRIGKYVEVGQQNANNFSEKNLLFPIPTSVMIENPNLVQNPGY